MAVDELIPCDYSDVGSMGEHVEQSCLKSPGGISGRETEIVPID